MTKEADKLYIETAQGNFEDCIKTQELQAHKPFKPLNFFPYLTISPAKIIDIVKTFDKLFEKHGIDIKHNNND